MDFQGGAGRPGCVSANSTALSLGVLAALPDAHGPIGARTPRLQIIDDMLWIVLQRAAEFRDAFAGVDVDHGHRLTGGALNMIRRAATHERAMTLERADGEGRRARRRYRMEDRQLLDHALAQLPLEQRFWSLEFDLFIGSFLRGGC